MNAIDLNTTVGELVALCPELSRLFEELQIDYCCGGDRSLQEACRQQGLDPSDMVDRLRGAAAAEPRSGGRDWRGALLAELCDHIEHTHHAYLRSEFPRLSDMLLKVAQAHCENHPELRQVQQLFGSLRAELELHMMKEERVLFPAVRQLETSSHALGLPFGSVASPIGVMEREHDVAGDVLKKLRQLTNNFQVPVDACNTYRAMLDGLHQLERDLHQHIHKENNILFPRAIELEHTLAGAGG